jgi:hypothetical protein
LIIRPAGVAQSVERVALISSDIPNLKVEGSSLMPENSFLAHFKFLKFVEACQDFRGPTPHGLSCQASTFFFSLFSPLSHLSGYVLH